MKGKDIKDKILKRLMKPKDIRDDIFKSYMRLRFGLAVLSFLFPISLLVLGWCYGIDSQNSMSAYYFAQPSSADLKYSFPMRVWFVGILWAVGMFLYFYKGFSRTENVFLNIAGISAIFVALFPMAVDTDKCPGCGVNDWTLVHAVAAGTLFFCMGIVAWACTDETLVMVPDWKRELLRWIYSTLATAMWIAPIVVFVLVWGGRKNHPGIYWAELLGVVIFATYWAVKSYELDALGTQKSKLSGTGLPSSPPPPGEEPTDEEDKGGVLTTVNDKIDAARHKVGRMFG